MVKRFVLGYGGVLVGVIIAAAGVSYFSFLLRLLLAASVVWLPSSTT